MSPSAIRHEGYPPTIDNRHGGLYADERPYRPSDTDNNGFKSLLDGDSAFGGVLPVPV